MPSLRHARPGLLVVTALATLLVTGCGSPTTETTCGDVRAMSAEERVALLDELTSDAQAAGGADADAFDTYADASAADRTTAADALVALCEPEGDDVTLQDADGVED